MLGLGGRSILLYDAGCCYILLYCDGISYVFSVALVWCVRGCDRCENAIQYSFWETVVFNHIFFLACLLLKSFCIRLHVWNNSNLTQIMFMKSDIL